MNTKFLTLIFISAFIFLSGCYHANVTTGLEPSAQVYEQTFASAWVFGLVPPNVVQAQNECRNGVARVETRLSFVNMLVGNLTFGIYTPMHIKVTCAADMRANIPSEDYDLYTINKNDSDEVTGETLRKATEKSLKTEKPFYIEMK